MANTLDIDLRIIISIEWRQDEQLAISLIPPPSPPPSAAKVSSIKFTLQVGQFGPVRQDGDDSVAIYDSGSSLGPDLDVSGFSLIIVNLRDEWPVCEGASLIHTIRELFIHQSPLDDITVFSLVQSITGQQELNLTAHGRWALFNQNLWPILLFKCVIKANSNRTECYEFLMRRHIDRRA